MARVEVPWEWEMRAWAMLGVLGVTFWGCGLRNQGEKCLAGLLGDLTCAPGRCDKDQHVCVECLGDLDCARQDPWDRPRCVAGIAKAAGGDGLPFCRHDADHASCTLPGSALMCTPGKCHPDAGVCVDCLKDGDCPSDKPVCDPGTSPYYITFCRAKTAL